MKKTITEVKLGHSVLGIGLVNASYVNIIIKHNRMKEQLFGESEGKSQVRFYLRQLKITRFSRQRLV